MCFSADPNYKPIKRILSFTFIKTLIMNRFYLLISVLALILSSCAEKPKLNVSLIPKADSLSVKEGIFNLDKELKVYSDFEKTDILKEYLAEFEYSYIKSERSKADILFIIDKSLAKSKYSLKIDDNIIVKSSTEEAALYAVQTIRQLIINSENSELPKLFIEDAPNYDYRGMHLDVSRHFTRVENVKKYIDYLAMFKMNCFHWHLVDDQGWRIEIKKYPKLTEIGSKRKNTLIGHGGIKPFKFDTIPHSGFYTQKEIKEIVKYADERGVTIIPEIEMPGHARAAIASYPYLGCTDDTIDVWNRWGVSPYIFNIDDTTFKFLENVLTEVAELFPSKYIHVGGDEAIKDQWIASDKIQAQMKDLEIENEQELQAYFIQRIADFLDSKGKTLIGWDEILHEGAPDNSVIMYWRAWIKENNPAIKAVENNHKVILTPSGNSYFDHYQSKDSTEPLAIGGYNPVDSVYLKSHFPKGFPENKKDLVWGIQANMWTEYMKDFNHIEYMLFPRMPALAEVLWTDKEKQNFDGFKSRFIKISKYFDNNDVNYAKHIFVE